MTNMSGTPLSPRSDPSSDVQILLVEDLTPEEEHQRNIRIARANEALDQAYQ